MKTDYFVNIIFVLFITAAVIVFLSVTTTSYAKGIFKCVNLDGEIEYTYSPSENCDPQAIKKRGGKGDKKAIEKSLQDRKKTDLVTDLKKEKQQRQKDKDQIEKEMKKYCQDVRDNLEIITTATRIFETDDQGNRIRLDEDQRLQRIQKNKDSLVEHCS